MNILNKTHLTLEQVSDDQVIYKLLNLFNSFFFLNCLHLKGGIIVDKIIIVKEKHGPQAWL
jgi:hypothetical protein